MRQSRRSKIATALALSCAAGSSTGAFADLLDQIGVIQLRQLAGLTGNGVIVAQPESTTFDTFDHDNFEVDPAAAGIPASTLLYIHNGGAFDSSYNPTLRSANDHASTVAKYLSGATTGVAPDVAQIENFNANYYVLYALQNFPISNLLGTELNPQVINQSFTQDPSQPGEGPYTAAVLNQAWDSFVATQGYTIVTAVGNGGSVKIPATAYNVISVGLYTGNSSVSQPGEPVNPNIVVDMPVADRFTSFATPVVSGAAALLVQASNGDPDATMPQTIKALLLNGAVKPADWTHSATVPLDRHSGAGLLNVLNSYHNFAAGEQNPLTVNSTTALVLVSPNVAHPAFVTSGSVSLSGWKYGQLISTATTDAVAHYVLDFTASTVPTILTATLVWQRAADDPLTDEIRNSPALNYTSSIYTLNNLDLFLYNGTSQVDQSISTVDAVEHLYSLNLSPGKYDLQVLKNGGTLDQVNFGPGKVFSDDQTYALAWTAVPITGATYVTNYSNLVFTQATAITVAAAISGGGTLTHSGTGTTTLTGVFTATGPVNISAGKLAFGFTNAARQTPAVLLNFSSLTITSNAKLDVTNHDLMIGNTSLATVESMIKVGMGIGSGPSITTSTALSPKRMALVPVPASWWSSNHTTSAFDGVVPTESNTVLVKYTFIGDLNLDGKVDGVDFAIASSHSGQSSAGLTSISASWLFGDVTFDGIVNGLDWATMAENYGAGYSGGVLDPQFIPIGSSQPVPEPASLLVLGMGSAGLLMTRKRRSPRRSMLGPNR